MSLSVALTVAAVLFAVGMFGALMRRDALGLVASLAVTVSATVMGLVAVSRFSAAASGAEALALLALALGGAELALAGALTLRRAREQRGDAAEGGRA